MTNQTRGIVALVLAIVIGVAIYGAYQYPQTQQIVSSPAGTSFSTSKVASQQLTLATTTFFSQLNTDASDRTILGFEAMIRGATATSTTYTVLCATSTTASGFGTNTNYIVQTSLATSTWGTLIGAGTFIATSSPGLTGTSTATTIANLVNPYIRNWAANSYLNCQVSTADNANAFNSTTNGTWSFPYRSQ